MTDIRQVSLSTQEMPSTWRNEFEKSVGPLRSNTFYLDAYKRPNGDVEIITGIDEPYANLLGQIKFSAEEVLLKPIPRGTAITLKGVTAKTVSAQWLSETISLPIQDSFDEIFCETNTVFSLSLPQSPEVINDWISYHAEEQNARSFLIFVREKPGQDISKFLSELKAHQTVNSIIVVPIGTPLGHPDRPSEISRHLAPDAPGKAMLPDPIPDAWTSPIVELAILEVARRRFLSDARAVLFCHPSDLVPRNADETVFDATVNGAGFVKFSGQHVYPFALKNNQAAKHADHNCVSFDGKRSDNIWCAAPKQLEPNAFWRQFRVSHLNPAPLAQDQHYWRCMAVRHPDLKVSELVPKSSLVVDQDLVENIKQRFDFEAKAPPAVSANAQKRRKNDRVLIVTTMKNEGPFILEWIAFHRAIGVTDFLVYTNDCTDGTDTMFDLLQSKGLVQHEENPYREMDMKPQHAAYQAASETDLADEADWIIGMDVDEFINIHVGDGTLKALFAEVPDATMISMTWRLFGNADVEAFEDVPIIEQFDQCAKGITRKPHQAWGFKTLFRNLGHYKKFGVHRPKGLKPEYLDHINWVNGSGQQMPPKMYRTGWRSSVNTIGYDHVMLNHYSLRSAESFLVKRDRGRVNHVDRDQGLSYWFRMNHNAQTGRTIANKFPMFRAELAKLMDDPEIAAAHQACVAAHKKRIAELMEAPEYRALYDEITGERLRALSRMLDQFGNQTFLDGPNTIPPDFHLNKV